jgi:hypothetical protein
MARAFAEAGAAVAIADRKESLSFPGQARAGIWEVGRE